MHNTSTSLLRFIFTIAPSFGFYILLIWDNHLFDVWVPDGGGPYPVMIYAHGGGFASGSKIKALGSMPKVVEENVAAGKINWI